MKKRLSKVLSAAGIASRRACETLIFEGRVAVNGIQVLVPQTLVEEETDHITVDEKPLSRREKKVYFLINKPAGFLCTSLRPKPQSKLVLDLFGDLPFRLFTVGRLDKDTTGLLIVTNDGIFANRVIHPSYNITKEYLAKTSQEICVEHLERLSKGARVDGIWVKPTKIQKVRRGTLKITVKEGRRREVRKLLESVGLTIIELARIRIGPLTLGSLPLGAWRELSESEKALFVSESN